MLSICVNVKNGARYLAKSLASLTKFDDVVLLDNYSTDNTLEIAKQFSNVRIFQCEFQGMGKVRNLAASYAKNDWILFVDCDEVLEQELVNILLTFPFEQGNIYNIYRKNYYDGRLVETSSWGNDWIKRLYNRNDTKFAENQVHDNFIDDLPNIRIDGGSMIHFPYEQVSQLIDKMQFYSTLYAKQHHHKKHPKLWMIPFRAFFMFLKCYILKRGFLSGYEGLAISSYNAMGVFSKYIKLYELDFKKKIAVALILERPEQIASVVSKLNKQTLLAETILILIKESNSSFSPSETLQLTHAFISGSKIIYYNDSVEEAINLDAETANYDAVALCQDTSLLSNTNFTLHLRKALQKNKTVQGIKFII